MPPPYSRRALLLGSAALLACGRKKATGYPGYCFVANRQSHTLGVLDLSTFRLWQPVRLDAAPTALVPHPREPKLYALAAGTGVLYEVDVASLSVVRRAKPGNLAIGILGAPSGDALWALYRDPPALIEIPFDSFQPRRRIRLPSPPDDFDLDSKHAAIASSRTGSVIIASLEHAAIERSARAGPAPFLVRFQQQGAQLAAASPSDRSVSMIEAASGKLMVRLPMPIEPSHFCLYGDGGQLFVTGQGQDVVVIIDPYRTQIAETILAGRRPGAMAVAGAYLLVTNPETNSVTVLDVENRKLAAVVQVGEEPRTILITPDQQYALVLNEKSGDVAVIRIASLAGRRYKSAPLFTLVPVGQEPVSAAVVTLV